MNDLVNDCYSFVTELEGRCADLEAEIARLREALQSIAANSCCDKCQEAALVARQALQESSND